MQKIIEGKELQEKILEAIHLLCETVKITLGPHGNNVIISSNESSPYITNDGVTIARNIESENPILNAILEIAKESSLKTNELVGDGTTTTLVLLESLIEKGYEVIQKGYSKMKLKKEMENCLKNILVELNQYKQKAQKKDYLEIAKISANDEELGEFLFHIFEKVKQKQAIHIIETNQEKTTYEQYHGYSLEIDVNEVLYKDQKEFYDPFMLLIDGKLESLEEISEILNPILNEKKHLIILANEFKEEVLEETAYLNLENENKIFCFEIPEYANRKKDILKDLEVLSNAKIWNKNFNEILSWSYLGRIPKLRINPSWVLFSYPSSPKLNSYKQKLKKQIEKCDNSYEKEFLEERYAKLKVGLIRIMIGGPSKTTIREEKMRMEDALSAMESTKKGVVIGGGMTLLKIKETVKPIDKGSLVCLEALEEPFFQILKNCGLDGKEIYKQIKESNWTQVYNAKTEEFENMNNTVVLDPFEVVQTSLKNAISIAGILLTTNYLVLNERPIVKNIEF